jgi:aminoglycoside phosphotransferase (APT) family kinase protein
MCAPDQPTLPHDIKVRLASAGLAIADDLQMTLLAGGYKNRVWRAGSVVVKVFASAAADDNPCFPNLPQQEALVLKHLKGSGLAPEFRCFLPERDGPAVLVYDYVEGVMWSDGVAAVAGVLNRLRRLAPFPGLRVLPMRAADVLAHGDRVLALAGGDALLSRLRPPIAAEQPCDPVLVHTDFGAGNIIHSAEGLRIIDWQCPGLGSPIEDIAAFLSPAFMILYGLPPHSPAAIDAFLSALEEPALVQHYHGVGAALHWRFACYCAYRRKQLVGKVSARYDSALKANCELLKGWR